MAALRISCKLLILGRTGSGANDGDGECLNFLKMPGFGYTGARKATDVE